MLRIAVVAVALAAAGMYWWQSRPPGEYTHDNGGLFPIERDGKYGFVDVSGKTVIAPQFDDAQEFSEGLALVSIGGKFGYIDRTGALVINPQFEAGSPFRYGRASVSVERGLWGYIDTTGTLVATPSYRNAWPFSGQHAPVQLPDGSGAIINPSGTVVVSGVNASTGFAYGLAPAKSGNRWGYVDATGRWIIHAQFDQAGAFTERLAPVAVGQKFGCIDTSGRFVVNPRYDWMGEFSEGYALVRAGAHVGFIDRRGREVTATTYADARRFSEGVAAVPTEQGWGYIDASGQMVIAPQFDDAAPFQNGLARIRVASRSGYITRTGALVVDPSAGRIGVTVGTLHEIWRAMGAGRAGSGSSFMLRREADVIGGYFQAAGEPSPRSILRGTASADQSFRMSDDAGRSWAGRFLSANRIQVTETNGSGTTATLTLRFIRESDKVEFDNAASALASTRRAAAVLAEVPVVSIDPAAGRNPPAVTETAAMVLRARSRFERREYQAALDDCQNALRLDPDHRDARELAERIRRTMAILGGR